MLVISLQKLLISLSTPLLYFSKKDNFIVFNFSRFCTTPAKDDAWGQRERLLTFQNMVQEILSNNASRAKGVTKKFSLFTSKKYV